MSDDGAPSTSAAAPVVIAAGELPLRYGDVEGSLRRIDALLADAAATGAALVLLPETAVTGYISPSGRCDLARFAEPLGGPTATHLAALARRHGVALAGPLIEHADRRVFNALLLFDRDGNRVGHWRKRHPWYPEQWATPGDLGTPVVELAGLRVTAGICFDVHFLSDDAGPSLDAADVLLFPSAWVDSPESADARATLLPALARRHGLWVVNANWGYGRRALLGQGGSRILDPAGREVARAPDARGPRVVATGVSARPVRRTVPTGAGFV